jgi:hypothetical protein
MDPQNVPEPPVCEDESFTRYHRPVSDKEFTWGNVHVDGTAAFALRTSDLAIALGDTVAVTLTNLTSEPATTAYRDFYHIELYTTEGWREVRGWKQGSPRPYPARNAPISPGRDSSGR